MNTYIQIAKGRRMKESNGESEYNDNDTDRNEYQQRNPENNRVLINTRRYPLRERPKTHFYGLISHLFTGVATRVFEWGRGAQKRGRNF